ncbi:MAG: 60S ribosomal protein L31 [Candidatus Aenigmarchaeota archaeon]|nr:60S ribosomal protein L31 [Candidatus Aenigmarchaeota archaeon]
MAEKTERVYNIPLRGEWVKVARIRRAGKSMQIIKWFLEKNTKSQDIKLSKGINEFVWRGGVKKPPGAIKVAVSIKEGKVFARLPEEKGPDKEEKKKGTLGKLIGKKGGPKEGEVKKEEPKKEEVKASTEEKKVEEKVSKEEKPTEKPAEEKTKKVVPKEEKVVEAEK